MREPRAFRWRLLGLVLAAALAPLPADAAPAAEPWTGDFADIPSASWKRQWGVLTKGDWGFDRMTPQGDALDVFYGKGSSAPSCGDCPSEGGGQFYTDFRSIGRADLADARTLYLSYQVRFPADWDFGERGGKLPGLYGGPPGQATGGQHGDAWSTRYMWRIRSSIGRADLADARTLYLSYQVRFPADWDFGERGGKLPGLYGGPPGQATGGQHGDAWSTRYMWRIRSDEPKATVYVYDPSMGSGYGEDVGLGAWNWAADGQWHTVQQSVDRSSGTITVWYDGREVLREQAVHEIADIPFGGILFSTFFGGHDTSWGPSRDVHAQFRDFRVSETNLR
ncbi:polysaccharide lyase [Saccharopolyspora thermophila]|uniref:Polysaccharide lyase 14 domain-containing protein n=1 Tax=Saccharopolyspora thermophila TaxID=89367 RepID=A0ABP3LLX5_9PSEU